jgi:hypothetical protein
LDSFGGNVASAYASFRVPAVSPGRYAVAFCSSGCARALGDVLPNGRFTIVADSATASLAARVKSLEATVMRQAQQALSARTLVAGTRGKLQRLRL